MPYPSQQGVVAQAKQDLLAAGVDLTGPCGAWRITNLAAWRLQARGNVAGLLSKPEGNNCRGYAVDIIAYPDGTIYDVLIASGDQNGPAWQAVGVVDPTRWRPAVFPDYDSSSTSPTPPTIPPLPSPLPPSSDLAERLAALEARMARLEVWTAQAPR